MEADKRIRRLQASITLLWVLVAGWIAYPLADGRLNASMRHLRVTREGDTISLSPSSDGPFSSSSCTFRQRTNLRNGPPL